MHLRGVDSVGPTSSFAFNPVLCWSRVSIWLPWIFVCLLAAVAVDGALLLLRRSAEVASSLLRQTSEIVADLARAAVAPGSMTRLARWTRQKFNRAFHGAPQPLTSRHRGLQRIRAGGGARRPKGRRRLLHELVRKRLVASFVRDRQKANDEAAIDEAYSEWHSSQPSGGSAGDFHDFNRSPYALLLTAAPKAFASTTASGAPLSLVDSGANIHCCGDLALLHDVRDVAPISINGIANTGCTKVGRLRITVPWGRRPRHNSDCTELILDSVHYVPTLSVTILSAPRLLQDHGLCFANGPVAGRGRLGETFGGMRTAKLVEFSGGLLGLPFSQRAGEPSRYPDLVAGNAQVDCQVNANISDRAIRFAPWHPRLGHLSLDSVKRILSSAEQPPSKDGSGKWHVENDDCVCESCLRGKMTRKRRSRTKRFWEAEQPNAVIFMDLVSGLPPGRGPTPNGRSSKCQHLVHFVDCATRMGWCYPINNKSDVHLALRQFLSDNQTHPQRLLLPQTLVSDGAGEIVGKNSPMQKLCRRHRIDINQVPAANSELNGVVERAHLTLFNMVRSMLHHSGLPASYWPTAAIYARHLLNLLPQRNNLCVENKEHGARFLGPYEMWSGVRPCIGHLRVYGCKAYVLQSTHKRKLADRCVDGIFLGLGDRPGSYQVEILETANSNKTRMVRDCYFDEQEFPGLVRNSRRRRARIDRLAWPPESAQLDGGAESDQPEGDEETGADSDAASSAESDQPDSNVENDADGGTDSGADSGADSDDSEDSGKDNGEEIGKDSDVDRNESDKLDSREENTSDGATSLNPRQRTRRATSRPKRYDPAREAARRQLGKPAACIASFCSTFGAATAFAFQSASPTNTALGVPVPNNFDPSYSQGIRDPAYGKHWLDAVNLEWKNLFDTGAVKWVKASSVPKGSRPISAKVVLKFKQHEARYKARIVLRGFEQRPGSYGETFAPTISASVVKLVMAIGVRNGWDIQGSDIKSAFLMSDLPDEVYMHPPDGFKQEGYVLKVCKSLYGLKQAPNLWHALLDSRLVEFGLTRSQLDPSLYFNLKQQIYVACHVDDLLVTAPNKTLTAFRRHLERHFTLSKSGTVNDFLGMQVDYDRVGGVLTLNQDAAVTNLLATFEANGCVPKRRVTTPLQVDVRLSAPNEDELEAKAEFERQHPKNHKELRPYQSGVGSLMHLACSTRPDISFAVSQLARFMSSYGPTHCAQLYHVIAYLRDAGKVSIIFRKEDLADLSIEAFVDSDWGTEPDMRRSCTGQIQMIGSTPICWKSQMQSRTALGSGEAEFVAIGEGARNVLVLRQILSEIGLGPTSPSIIWSDADAAINGLKTLRVDSNLKHVQTRFHRTRDEIRDNNIALWKIATCDNLADAFTKQLTGPKFLRLFSQIFGGGYSGAAQRRI